MADDNGVYTYDGCPTNLVYYENGTCFTAHQNENNGYYIKRRAGRKYNEEMVNRKSIFVLYRTYRRHSFHKDYSNIICRIKDIDGAPKNYCLVINDWTNGHEENNFIIPCHGNAKSHSAKSSPFIRTEQNVLKSMGEQINKGEKPQVIYHEAINSSGGPFKSVTQSQEPRNKKQVLQYFICLLCLSITQQFD